MSKPISDEEAQYYMDEPKRSNVPQGCPYCEYIYVAFLDILDKGNGVFREKWGCPKCDRTWEDVYAYLGTIFDCGRAEITGAP